MKHDHDWSDDPAERLAAEEAERAALEGRITRALILLDEHRWVGTLLETECVCIACEMGRILRGEDLRS